MDGPLPECHLRIFREDYVLHSDVSENYVADDNNSVPSGCESVFAQGPAGLQCPAKVKRKSGKIHVVVAQFLGFLLPPNHQAKITGQESRPAAEMMCKLFQLDMVFIRGAH